jgi:hypothetical protein
MPSPPSLGGAGLAAVAQAVRLSGRRGHLAVRRCRQRPSIDCWAWDFKPCSFRHVTRVSPSHGFSVFSPLPALSAGACPLALSGSGKPLTQGSPLNPSHLRWGCCLNYCGAPDAGGSQVQAVVRVRRPSACVPLAPDRRQERRPPSRGRSVKNICAGSWVIMNSTRAFSATACGVTPQPQKTGISFA